MILLCSLHKYHNLPSFATAVRSVAVSALESYAAGSEIDGVTIFIF